MKRVCTTERTSPFFFEFKKALVIESIDWYIQNVSQESCGYTKHLKQTHFTYFFMKLHIANFNPFKINAISEKIIETQDDFLEFLFLKSTYFVIKELCVTCNYYFAKYGFTYRIKNTIFPYKTMLIETLYFHYKLYISNNPCQESAKNFVYRMKQNLNVTHRTIVDLISMRIGIYSAMKYVQPVKGEKRICLLTLQEFTPGVTESYTCIKRGHEVLYPSSAFCWVCKKMDLKNVYKNLVK